MFFDDRKKVCSFPLLYCHHDLKSFSIHGGVDSEVLWRRQVSLGGKSRKGNESKQAFVDRTRQEREAREAERRRQSCATKIQEQPRNCAAPNRATLSCC